MYYRAITKRDEAEGSIQWSLHTTPFELTEIREPGPILVACCSMFSRSLKKEHANRLSPRDTRGNHLDSGNQSEQNTLPEKSSRLHACTRIALKK